MVAPTEERTQQDVDIKGMTLQDFFAGVIIAQGPPQNGVFSDEYLDGVYSTADRIVAFRQNRGRPKEDIFGE